MRARNIKPGFYKNADLAERSIWARFIYPGLWMLADKAGRLEDRPKQIRGELVPYDDEAPPVDKLLQELHDFGFILRYELGGKRLIQILGFSKHQSPHYSEKESVINGPPLPESGALQAPEPPDDSEKEGGLKRGSKPPDCGFLIPDSRLLKPTGARAELVACGQLVEDGLDEELAEDWLAHRKRRKAPLTPRAWETFKEEAAKASWAIDRAVTKAISRNWTTFEAAWVLEPPAGRPQAAAWRRSHEGIKRMATELGVDTVSGESWNGLADRVDAALEKSKAFGKVVVG